MSDKLSVLQTEAKLNTTDMSYIDKPTTNKGGRGQFLEIALGIKNSSELIDLIDGELKTFTKGESIAVTMLRHCLSEIINDSVEFEDSKVYKKLKQTIYVGFDRKGNFLKSKTISEQNSPEHYLELAEDYGYISAQIKAAYSTGTELHTITGPNNLLQIRTKASKKSDGTYTPLTFNGVELKNKAMAFYLLRIFGNKIVS